MHCPSAHSRAAGRAGRASPSRRLPRGYRAIPARRCDAAPSFRYGEQGAVATEAGAERGEPPPAARRALAQRELEHEIDERAAEVSILSQYARSRLHIG